MKFSRLLLLITPVLVASCGSISTAPVEAPGIIVAQDEVRELGQGKTLFPAGVYKPEVVSSKGTYYKAPRRLKALGVLIGRNEEGGIFISNTEGNPQAAWYGDPRDEADGSPGTLFGAMGVSAPKLWKLTPRIPYTMEKQR